MGKNKLGGSRLIPARKSHKMSKALGKLGWLLGVAFDVVDVCRFLLLLLQRLCCSTVWLAAAAAAADAAAADACCCCR